LVTLSGVDQTEEYLAYSCLDILHTKIQRIPTMPITCK